METTSSGPVVVGVDRSDGAREAVAWAADLASAWGAALHLVHAVPAEPDPTGPFPWLGELLDTVERAGSDRPQAEFPRGLVINLVARLGLAARVTDTLGRLLGRPTTTLATYLHDRRDRWTAT